MSAEQPYPFARAACFAPPPANPRRRRRGRRVGASISEAGVIFAYALVTLALAPQALDLQLSPPVASMDSLPGAYATPP